MNVLNLHLVVNKAVYSWTVSITSEKRILGHPAYVRTRLRSYVSKMTWLRNPKREECFYRHSSRNGNSRRMVEHIQMVFLFKKLRFIADSKISSKSFPYFGRRHLRGKHDMTHSVHDFRISFMKRLKTVGLLVKFPS
jgi:hypothetical protein